MVTTRAFSPAAAVVEYEGAVGMVREPTIFVAEDGTVESISVKSGSDEPDEPIRYDLKFGGVATGVQFLRVREVLFGRTQRLLGDDPGSSKLDADGIFIEGGLYVTGDFDFDGPDMVNAVPAYPLPPDYYMLSINALDYCYPALLVYEEPSSGVITDWGPDDTPPVGSGPNLSMSASGDEGPVYWNGVVYNQGGIHLHHTCSTGKLLIRKHQHLF